MLKYMYHRHPFNGPGRVELFTSYHEMVGWLTTHLTEGAKKHTEDTEFRKKWGMDRFPSQVESLLRDLIPEEHSRKLGSLEIEYRFFGEPKILIGKEKPLADPMPKEHCGSFGAYEISYSCGLPIEVRAKYKTKEGEVKEPGKPYVPAHEEEFYTPSFKVFLAGGDYEGKFSLVDVGSHCKLWYYCFWNGHIEIVHHGD